MRKEGKGVKTSRSLECKLYFAIYNRFVGATTKANGVFVMSIALNRLMIECVHTVTSIQRMVCGMHTTNGIEIKRERTI